MNRASGLLVVISSPSGGGKTTVIRKLLRDGDPRYTRSISLTTRLPRPGEIDGRDYYFVDRAAFDRKVADGELIEYEQVHGYFYGTPKRALQGKLAQGFIVFLAIDVHGALSIKKIFSRDSLLIFLKPPSLECLKERLARRKTEQGEDVEARLSRYSEEMDFARQFDCIILNDRLSDTVAAVRSKIIEKMSSRE